MKVWVVIEDYGLNGSAILGVYSSEAKAEDCARVTNNRHSTGWSGVDVEEWEVMK